MTDRSDPIAGRSDRGWSYLPALDGVRALAVVAVVLFHFWPATFPGGFVGVDVFFVMSGFLITGIIEAEHYRSGGVDLRRFWGRRIRRLVPAVVVLVVVTAVATVLTGTASARQFADSVGALTWTTNLVEAFLGGSRALLHNPRTTIDHLWSLAIEEQFYVVWPLVALLLLRRVRGRRRRVAIVLGLVAASALANGLVGGPGAYFRTETRAFELLAGAALALAGWGALRIGAALASLLAGLGLVGLVAVVPAVSSTGEWMYPWGFLLITAIAAALVAAAVHPPAWLRTALCSPPIRHLGQVSYGVYLWHIPVLRLLSSTRTGLDGPLLHLLRLAVLVVVVEVSFRFVEQPFRTGRLPLRWPQFAVGYGAATVAVLLLVPATGRDIDGQWDAIDPPPSVTPGQTRVLVLGDLVGAAVATGLERDASSAVWSLVDPGCPLDTSADYLDGEQSLEVDEFCLHWAVRWTRAVRRFGPDVVVLAAGYWDSLAVRGSSDGPTGSRLDAVVRQRTRVLGEAGVDDGSIVLVSVEEAGDLLAPAQRPLDQREAALDRYRAALEGVADSTGCCAVASVDVADGWDDLRRTGLGELEAASR